MEIPREEHATKRLLLGLSCRRSAADWAKRRAVILFPLDFRSFHGKTREKQKKLEGFSDHSFNLVLPGAREPVDYLCPGPSQISLLYVMAGLIKECFVFSALLIIAGCSWKLSAVLLRAPPPPA